VGPCFAGAQMDVEAVLQSVQERDKWRRRLELLQASLLETRDRKKKSQGRLRRIRSDLRRLTNYSDAILDQSRDFLQNSRANATSNSRIPAR
jgi:hypothetical protein